MKANKRFDVEKANELLTVYKKKRKFAKATFLEELIYYQNFFGSKSILDCYLLLSRNYLKKTVSAVLVDLGYLTFDINREHGHMLIKFK